MWNKLAVLGALGFGAAVASASGCAEQQQPETITVIKAPEREAPKGGIPPDKMAEIQYVLQQRDSSARKCYQDVLDQKHTRAFRGDVIVVITLGTDGHATNAKVIKSTLNDSEVESCLCEKIKEWDYPTLKYGGDVEQVYKFEPQY